MTLTSENFHAAVEDWARDDRQGFHEAIALVWDLHELCGQLRDKLAQVKQERDGAEAQRDMLWDELGTRP